ncbi:MAG TPA: hypothetical protein VGQ57_09490, partial [Polyangiaceae bacterium]|nr:hypothetical protein [Polyangiaceae bacterium]
MPASRSFPRFALPLLALAAAACGGNEPQPKDASVKDEAPSTHDGPTIVASSEIGGMNEDDVDAIFKTSVKGLQRCLDAGARHVEFLGGSVSF